jgi:hypothetical protein
MATTDRLEFRPISSLPSKWARAEGQLPRTPFIENYATLGDGPLSNQVVLDLPRFTSGADRATPDEKKNMVYTY